MAASRVRDGRASRATASFGFLSRSPGARADPRAHRHARD